jgi:hypothetical protein
MDPGAVNGLSVLSTLVVAAGEYDSNNMSTGYRYPKVLKFHGGAQ